MYREYRWSVRCSGTSPPLACSQFWRHLSCRIEASEGTPLMGIDFNSAGKNANPPISTPGYATPMTSKYAPKQTTTRGHTVQINNIEMYYEEYGAGKPLVPLHGFGGWAQNWHPFTRK